LLNEEQELESRQAELFGLNVPNQTWQQEIAAAESFWLSSVAIQRCVSSYLSARLGTDTEHVLGEKSVRTLRLSQDARSRLLDDCRRLPRSSDTVTREWEKWLKGGQPTLAVTFDQVAATENPKVVHLSVIHPLVRQAAKFLQLEEPAYTSLRITSFAAPLGTHPFAIFRWKKLGVKVDELLVPVSSVPAVEDSMLVFLQSARDMNNATPILPSDIDKLHVRHHEKWTAAQAKHIAENRQQVEHRIQSLKFSHQARCSAIEAQIARATNDRISLMKESELARANADFNRHMEELQQAASSGDIHAAAILFGTIHIQKEEEA
jgi:hypothetical protein